MTAVDLVPEVPVTGSVPRWFETVLSWMRPRDHRLAARTVSGLCGAAVVVTVVTLPLGGNRAPSVDPVLGLCAVAGVSLVAVLSLAARYFDEGSRLAWAVSPALAVTAIVLADLATRDATVSGQVFFVFPTVYGAALLPRPGAIVMTAMSLAGEIVVVFADLAPQEALLDSAYLATAMATIAVLLVRSSERQADLVSELARLALVDPLTGLVTRRGFDDAMATALGQPVDTDGTSLLLLDVDRFKGVNDRFGHLAGDQVLIELSGLLVGMSRRGDVVCRMGGDELAVLLPRCAAEAARRRAEEILDLVRSHGFLLDVEESVTVSVSAGLAHAPTHGSDARTLYAAADAALYRAKRDGRDRLVTWSGAA